MNEDLKKKAKIERLTACVNCEFFIKCDDFGQVLDCDKFEEVSNDKLMVIIRLEEYSN